MGDRVTLEIEGTSITCSKRQLTENSDYFKVMFEGNFAERYKSFVKLLDVDLKSMNIILILLWDDNYVIENKDILSVLQMACMLQFDKIRRICIERITEMLSPENCIKVWFMTEPLDLKPLYLKAKSMALTEFSLIKDMDCLLELNILQLYVYLADIKLRCNNEMDIFETCMKWWYHNSGEDGFLLESADETRILLYFLCCIDFKSISISDIKEMMSYPDVSENHEVVDILQSVTDLQQNAVIINTLPEIVSKAKWLTRCKSRVNLQFLCIVVDDFQYSKRPKLSTEIYSDKFKRKRTCILLETVGIRTRRPKNVLLFDDRKGRFIKLFSIPQEKHANLEGFHILGYKEFVFFFGGEISLGRGNWNNNFWVYDTIRERWERKSKMPYGRRHFESCISGNILYIVGGTGSYRVIQDTMFFYNYRDNVWSKQITLPSAGRQVKCCDFNNQLFLLNINSKCGYLFDLVTTNWIQMDICDTKNLVKVFPEKFTLFSYKDSLYIKGSSIIELKVTDMTLEVTNSVYLQPIYCDQMESVLCDDILYTIYKQMTDEQTKSISIEKFHMSTYYSEYVLERISDEAIIDLSGEMSRFTLATKVFGFQHYSLVTDESFVTDYVF